MKILNLYAGIGGNRKLWGDEHEITAIEYVPEIAEIYKKLYPRDTVIVTDAHQYLLEHFKEFDFIWSSPPCPTHSRMRLLINNDFQNGKMVYPDMKLYEEILLLTYWFKGKWVVENVVSYYDPLIKPFVLHNHYFWANFVISGKSDDVRGIIRMSVDESIQHKENKFDFDLSMFDVSKKLKQKMLNNCVNPETGLFIFNQAFKTKQVTIGDYD